VTRYVCAKIAQNVAQRLFVKISTLLFSGENSYQKIGRHTKTVFNKMPKVNNHPTGKNSPNLVTLNLN
jgi:hypothetical protein